MIEVQHLRKVFGKTVAVDDVSLSVGAGRLTGLLGPNGAGKTTIVNCLTTLLRPDGGTARVAGADVVASPAAVRAQIALTGQFAAVDEVLSGRQNLVLFGRLLGLRLAAARDRADELLTRFDLTEVAGKPVATYSGGSRRRIDLAISLVVPRPVMFLDEPTTGLDPRSRRALWDAIRDLLAAGTTILLTTQYLEEADRLADDIVVIDRGRVVAQGTAAELKARVGGSVCEIRMPDERDTRAALTVLSGVYPGVSVDDDMITVPEVRASGLGDVIRRLEAAGLEADDLNLRHPTLDDVFLALTGSGERATAGAGS